MTAPITSADLVRMLKHYHLPPGRFPAGIFAPEVMSPCGSRRADALWLPTTTYTGANLVGYEIKVSRSDLAIELADPAKADPWAQYCARWWLVVADPALIEGQAIPDAWGVMAPPARKGWTKPTVLRNAPDLRPVNPAPALARLLKWQMVKHRDDTDELRTALDRMSRTVARLEETQTVRTVMVPAVVTPDVARLDRIITQARARLQDAGRGVSHFLWHELTDDVVIDTLADVVLAREAAKRARFGVQRLIADAERIIEPLSTAKALAAIELTAALAESGVGSEATS